MSKITSKEPPEMDEYFEFIKLKGEFDNRVDTSSYLDDEMREVFDLLRRFKAVPKPKTFISKFSLNKKIYGIPLDLNRVGWDGEVLGFTVIKIATKYVSFGYLFFDKKEFAERYLNEEID